mmetsp:Transcript_9782/g.32209  ORF Transcript_9782/g.32209 Transcript_9782/m.32209 type:complete len:200 (-) Transcript_9782:652-1251(-)
MTKMHVSPSRTPAFWSVESLSRSAEPLWINLTRSADGPPGCIAATSRRRFPTVVDASTAPKSALEYSWPPLVRTVTCQPRTGDGDARGGSAGASETAARSWRNAARFAIMTSARPTRGSRNSSREMPLLPSTSQAMRTDLTSSVVARTCARWPRMLNECTMARRISLSSRAPLPSSSQKSNQSSRDVVMSGPETGPTAP